MSKHKPRLEGGIVVATRAGTAVLLNRHPDQVSRHAQPIACDLKTRLALYDVEAVERATKALRRRVA